MYEIYYEVEKLLLFQKYKQKKLNETTNILVEIKLARDQKQKELIFLRLYECKNK